ncbi:MAG: dihydrofolate reductase [Burkholderiales bacterium]
MALGASGAVALVAAVARNGVIGAGNALPWKLSADLAHFRALTTGHTVIMGRKTWQSLGRPLKGRQNVVVTRDRGYTADGAVVVASLPAAIAAASLPAPVFCIGGGELYAEALPLASAMHLTEIDRDFEGDVRFPAFDRREWRVASREEHATDDGMRYAFVTYQRNEEK